MIGLFAQHDLKHRNFSGSQSKSWAGRSENKQIVFLLRKKVQYNSIKQNAAYFQSDNKIVLLFDFCNRTPANAVSLTTNE